jgi:hypothetical protein
MAPSSVSPGTGIAIRPERRKPKLESEPQLTIGIARATTKIGLANLVYNIKRLLFLRRIAAAYAKKRRRQGQTIARALLLDDGRQSNSLARAKSYRVLIASERQFLQWLGRSAPEEQVSSS